MYYIKEYEICALIFLVVVTFRFMLMPKFRNIANRMFEIVLFCAMLNITLDIIGSFMIEDTSLVAPWLNYLVNTLYYMLQVAFPAIMLIYVVVLSGSKIPRVAYALLLPALIDEIFLIMNPFTGMVFYLEKTSSGLVYTHGPAFVYFYYVGAFYLVATAAAVIYFRRSFRKTEIRTILSFDIIVIVATVIQVIYPRLLLTGVAMSIAIFMMFLTMQNPETMLDSITGAFNYSALNDYLRKIIGDKKSTWITAVDVGGIRRINSMMGIRTSNELLERVGNYIVTNCGRHAKTFRMIGTRFVIVCDDCDSNSEIVANITERFKKPWAYGKSEVVLMATIRYCTEKIQFSSPEEIVSLVDLAYSDTSDGGFGTTKAIDSAQMQQYHRNKEIRIAIRRAISSGKGFYLNYQPIFSVSEKRFIGAEALLRLYDPTLGQISPAEFIPVAESNGMIHQIDRIVIHLACGFLKAHPELTEYGLHLLEINLSAVEFNGDTENFLHSIEPDIASIEDKICFEVTETAVTSRREVLSEFMHVLIDRGVRFAIDDFGTGYANITQVSKLPFSVVKLDRTFIAQNNAKESTILTDLVGMFRHIGLTTVLEGVETEDQAAFAESIGVDQIQGFYYSVPLSGDKLLSLMRGGQADEQT